MKFVSLVRRELSDQVSSLRFLALTGTVAILGVFAVHAGSIDLALRQEISTELIRQRTVDQARNGGRLAALNVEPGLRVVRPPSEWSLFVHGIDATLPAYWDFSPSRLQASPSAVAPQPAASSLAGLDIEFLIRVVLGLLSLLMGRDSIVRDRDNGTLHALLSQPVPSWMVLASKVTGAAIALVLSVTLLLAGASIGTGVWRPDLLSRAFLEFLGGVFVVAILYLLLLLLIGMALGATLRSGRVAISLSIVLWLYLVLLAPLLIPLIGTVLANPHPAVEAQLQAAYDKEFKTTEEEVGRLFAASYPPGTDLGKIKKPDEATTEKLEGLWHFRAAVSRGVLDAHETEAQAEGIKQRRVIRFLLSISPASSLSEGLASMAGTSLLLQERWEAAVRARQRALNTLVFDDPPRFSLRVGQDNGLMMFSFERHKPRVIHDIPPFDAPASTPASRLADAGPNMLVLGGYSVLALAWTFVAFLRRDA